MAAFVNIEAEYSHLNTKNEWNLLYQKIRSESAKNGGVCTEAIKPQNKDLNRYRDVSPYDHSRIVLHRGTTDYINANLVKVDKANRQYILTQAPLANTVNHLWLMVWEQKSPAILMLNKLIENRQKKCHQYWPPKIGPDHMMTMEDVGLTLEYTKQEDHSYYLVRTLRLTDIETKDHRDILQFHYTTWPDFGLPSSPTAFLEFLRKVRDCGVLEGEGPAIVHCSAGIGRSGTFCLVDSCLILIEKYGIDNVDVKEILYEMRKFRMGLIQTPDQLRFSYQAIIEGAKQLGIHGNTDIEENNVFINSASNSDEASDGSEVGEGDDDDDEDGEDDEGPPPVPPPRLDSLQRPNGSPVNRPLPNIPNSESLSEISYTGEDEKYTTGGPLPAIPADNLEESGEDDLEEEIEESEPKTESLPSEESPVSEDRLSPSELRHRKRVEHKEKLEAKVNDMKRRQKVNEQWTQLKRSLYKPLIVAGALVVGGGFVAYLYFKN